MVNDTTPGLQSQPQTVAPTPAADPVAATFEALTWCEQQGARITFQRGDDGRMTCTIEVLAPGSTWNLLRHRGCDFLAAVGAARGQWTTLGRGRGAA
jgi:hypothetical protein